MPKLIEYRGVIGFPGYCVGSDGSIWGCRVTLGNQYSVRGGTGFGKWRRMKPQKAGTKDYSFVMLRRDGRYHNRYAHRLVLEAFIGPCPEGMECRHFPNADVTDNQLSNLSWGTKHENAKDKEYHGTVNRGERNGGAKLTEVQVREIKRLCANGCTQKSAGAMFNVSQQTVQKIIHGKKWKHVI